MERRELLKTLGAAAAGVATGAVPAAAEEKPAGTPLGANPDSGPGPRTR